MYAFHVAIHARLASTRDGDVQRLASHDVATLHVPTGETCAALPVTFEAAVERLARLPRMFCEPDGSFVWVAETNSPPWQVDGTLYDGHGRLAYVELKGNCPEANFNLLLQACGWPETMLTFQLVRQGVFLNEASFREHARCAAEK